MGDRVDAGSACRCARVVGGHAGTPAQSGRWSPRVRSGNGAGRSRPVDTRQVESASVRSEVRRVSAADVGPVVAEVAGAHRARSVLLVSVSSDTGRPRVDPQLLVDGLAADLDIVVFTDMAAALAWSDLVDDDLRAYGGAIRLVNRADDPDPGGVFLTYPGTDPMLTVSRIRRRLTQPRPAVTRPAAVAPTAVGLPVVPPMTPPLRPTPNLLRRGPVPASVTASVTVPERPSVPDPAPGTAALLSEIDGLRSEVVGLRAETARLRDREQAIERELFQAWDELQTRDDLIQSMTDGGVDRAEELYDRVVQADPERQFRHVLALRMVMTLAEADRPEAALHRLRIGPRWLEDLERLPSVSKLKLVKVLDAVLEVLGGRVWASSAREVHQQRTGPGGEDPFLRRRSDDAVARRASLQQKTPQARRLLWWALPGDIVELSRVAAHDDYTMP